ncbi:MAG TPA: IclR family transcriptional regulator [Pseudonocardia sp.]
MPGAVQSIERGASVLQLLSHGSGRLSVGEIASSLDLAKGTVHGILRTLQGVGLIEQDGPTGRYQLGAALVPLAASYLNRHELRARSINWAEALARHSGEAVRVGIPLAGRVLVVHHAFRPDDRLQTLDVGSRLPLHATALGKVLLSHDPELAGSLRRSDLEPFTRKTVASLGALDRMLNKVREAGWAGEDEEWIPGEAGVAAAVPGHGGVVAGAIGITGTRERIHDGRGGPNPQLITYVRDAARAISRDLGAGRW